MHLTERRVVRRLVVSMPILDNISGARNEKQMIEAYLKRKFTQLSSVSEFRIVHFGPFATLARTP